MTDAALDLSRLAKLQKLGGAPLVTSLIDSFLAEGGARRAALAGEDPDAVAQVAHTLVASAGQLGAVPLAAEAQALDEAHRWHDNEGARQIAARMLTTYDDALAALRRYRETV